jgi:hypothetical protein
LGCHDWQLPGELGVRRIQIKVPPTTPTLFLTRISHAWQGWCAYGYYTHDPFILAANIPGLVLSLWLNMGAAKLQYYQLRQSDRDVTNGEREAVEEESSRRYEDVIFVSQEVILLRILILWILILVSVGWLGLVDGHEVPTIGLLVNINLIFFYGAPLQTLKTVITEKCSDSIHAPTMVMNW